MATGTMVRDPTLDGYNMERIICYCYGSSYLGVLWQRQKILIHCDNLAVVAVWESGSTHAKETMALVRLLYYCAARYNINICVVHIAGVNNVIADCLSRFQQDRFRQLVPLANPIPATIPAWLIHSFIDASCSATIFV